MAAHGWRSGRSVIEWLRAEPFRFDFYQALRHLESLRPDAVPVGEKSHPRAEAVVFKAQISQQFPAADIEGLTAPEEMRGPLVMNVTFMGLAGALGPLPPAYSERIIERIRARDFTARDFLDIFNHRLISLMARLRRQVRPELSTRAPWQSPLARKLSALIGIETPGLQERLAIPDRSLLHHAGLLASVRRSQHGLVRLLSDFTGLPVRVSPLQGGWLALDSTQISAIGVTGRNNRLGQDAMIGNRLWDQQAGITITIGPLGRAELDQCLPGGVAQPRLAALVGLYTRQEVTATLRLRVRAEEIPQSRLVKGQEPRLGWTSWLKSEPASRWSGVIPVGKLL